MHVGGFVNLFAAPAAGDIISRSLTLA